MQVRATARGKMSKREKEEENLRAINLHLSVETRLIEFLAFANFQAHLPKSDHSRGKEKELRKLM